MADRYVLVRKNGKDILHRNPREECNTDDADRKEDLDEATASSLMRGDFVRRCEHCNSEDS